MKLSASNPDKRTREQTSLPDAPALKPGRRPRKVGVMLLPGFSSLSHASVVDPLRAANALSGRELYRWFYLTATGEPAVSSAGAVIMPQHRAGDDVDLDVLMLCAGGNPAAFRDDRLVRWLRKLAYAGVVVGGVSGGSYILARAGLLRGYRCTIHWEHIPAFHEEFPEIDVRRTLFEIDRNRWTCAGGIAALDLLLVLIEADYGGALAAAVGDWLLHTQGRAGDNPQTRGLRERFQVSHPKLLRVLEMMEQHIDEPITRGVFAEKVGLSVRQVERLFQRYLHRTIRDHYMIVRLEHGRQLLRQTALTITETSVACGFVSSSHFARLYRQYFGRSPNEDRQRKALAASMPDARADRILVDQDDATPPINPRREDASTRTPSRSAHAGRARYPRNGGR
jgi:transcriptional regulator GlxA family with amidase domain